MISILIPALGERDRIGRCINAVLAQSWPKERTEIVLVDASPEDGTADYVRALLRRSLGPTLKVVENPGGSRSSNLNLGLQESTGELIVRVDARSAIPSGYLEICEEVLAQPEIMVVGGSQHAVALSANSRQTGIARGLNNRFAMGMAKYRRSSLAGPADTVYLGAFRRHDLLSVGGWDESLDVNEDYDLNQRLSRYGLIWFEPILQVDYTPRESLRSIATQYWGFGRWKARYLLEKDARIRPRQLVGVAVLPVFLGLIGLFARLESKKRSKVAVFGVAAALVLESLGGGAQPKLLVRERFWSVLTCATVVTSWSGGLWAEMLGMQGKRPEPSAAAKVTDC